MIFLRNWYCDMLHFNDLLSFEAVCNFLSLTCLHGSTYNTAVDGYQIKSFLCYLSALAAKCALRCKTHVTSEEYQSKKKSKLTFIWYWTWSNSSPTRRVRGCLLWFPCDVAVFCNSNTHHIGHGKWWWPRNKTQPVTLPISCLMM